MKNKVLCHLSDYKVHLTVGPMLKMLEALFELFVPFVVKDIVDNGINGENQSISYILIRFAILIGLAAVGFACSTCCQNMAARASEGYGMKLRNALFEHVTELSQSDIDSLGTSSLVVRINNDVATLQNGVAQFIRLITRAPFLVVGATVMAFIIDPIIALIFVCVAPVLFGVIYFILSRTIPMYGRVQAKLDNTGKIVRENVAGVKVVRAFGREESEEDRFYKATDELQGTAIHVGKISATLNPVTRVILNIAIIILLYFGGQKVYAGGLTQGDIMALVNYLMQISIALEVVVSLVIVYTKVFASYKRVKQVMDTESSLSCGDMGAENIDNDKPIVSFENVDFGYQNAGIFAKGYDFVINRGEFVGIIGATGSGKSTVARMIARNYDVTAGSVNIGGVDVRNFRRGELSKLIAIAPQKNTLFSGTLRENLQYRDKNATDEELCEVLKLADAYDFVMEKGGLDMRVEKGGSNFSGGQKQRLCIARAMVGESDIMIFDDSTSALDFATEAKVLSNIMNYRKKQAKILISLRVNSIKNADKIIVLDHGKIVGMGKHEDLLRDCVEYREIYNSQNDVKSEEVAV